jgi:hypothetical protein
VAGPGDHGVAGKASGLGEELLVRLPQEGPAQLGYPGQRDDAGCGAAQAQDGGHEPAAEH